MIDVEVKEKDINSNYPKLMIGTKGSIYLMIGAEKGIVISPSDQYQSIGEIRNDLDIECLNDYQGSIILKNK